MLDIQCLKDFLVLAELKHFGRAAEACHVTTSGLSRRIQALEFWLGGPAFTRSAVGVELTDAGRRLHAVAAEVTYALEGVRRTVREELAGRRERIQFCAPHIMSVIFFPDWLAPLHTHFRRTRFSVTSDHLATCFAALDQDEEDFVIFLLDSGHDVLNTLGRSINSDTYHMRTIGKELLVPVCAPSPSGKPMHALTNTKGKEVSLLGYSDECSLAWVLESQLSRLESLPPLVRHHENSLADGLRGMALAGLGTAWIPAKLVTEDLAARRLLAAGGPSFNIAMEVVIARKTSPLNDCAEALWQFLEANSESDGERDRKRDDKADHSLSVHDSYVSA